MKLKDFSQEEIESMGYDDIAEIILQESGKKLKTIDLYKKVTSALGEPENLDKIGDFFEILSTNKKFTLISGQWDLKRKHNSKVIIDDEDDDVIENVEDMPELKEENEEDEDIFYETDDNEDDEDDDLKDLLIIDEDEDDSSIM